jgi:plasmid maintenance system antidote protein VapI
MKKVYDESVKFWVDLMHRFELSGRKQSKAKRSGEKNHSGGEIGKQTKES